MSGELRSANAVAALKIEGSAGTFEEPSGTDGAIAVSNVTVTFNPQNVEAETLTGSLDPDGPIPGGTQIGIDLSVFLKGNGIPGTPSEWDALMRIAGFSATENLATIAGATFAADSGGQFTDSASGLAALTVGTVITTSGFANSANNGEFIVTESAAGSITVTKANGSAPGLVTEAAGGNVTFRYFVAGTAASTGSATGLSLAAPFSSTAQIYRGLPILLSGNPATPAWSQIMDYTADRVATLVDTLNPALDATTIGSIPANVLYAPISTGIPTASMDLYIDGIRYRFRGMRASPRVEFSAAGPVMARFRLTGLYSDHGAQAVPQPSYDGTRAGVFRNSAMRVNRASAALSSLAVDGNVQLVYPPDPNDSEGFGVPLAVRRRMAGTMDPNLVLPATRDLLAAFRAGDEHPIAARVMGGNAARPGQRIGLVVPAAVYESYGPGDRQGVAIENVGFFCRGQNAGAFLCVW